MVFAGSPAFELSTVSVPVGTHDHLVTDFAGSGRECHGHRVPTCSAMPQAAFGGLHYRLFSQDAQTLRERTGAAIVRSSVTLSSRPDGEHTVYAFEQPSAMAPHLQAPKRLRLSASSGRTQRSREIGLARAASKVPRWHGVRHFPKAAFFRPCLQFSLSVDLPIANRLFFFVPLVVPS